MSQASLQSVTLETLANSVKAAEHAVDVYRAGGRRLVAVIDERVTAPTVARTERYAPKLADALRRSGSRVGKLAVKGIDAVSRRTDAVITASSARVAAQVRRLARVAGNVSNPLLANGLDTAARVSLPGAKAALALSERVAAVAAKLPVAKTGAAARGTGKTAKAVGATKPVKATQPAARRRTSQAAETLSQRVQKAAKRTGAQVAKRTGAQATKARRRVAKASQEVVAAVKPVVRSSRKQVRAAVQPLTKVIEKVQAAAA